MARVRKLLKQKLVYFKNRLETCIGVELERFCLSFSPSWVNPNDPLIGLISRDFDIERLIGQDITALTSLFDQQVIDREEFRDILVQGEVLPSANEVKSE